MYQASRRLTRDGWCGVFIFRFVSCTGGAEPTFVVSFVESITTLRGPGHGHPPPQFADTLAVKRLGRAHEDVITAMLCVESKGGSHFFEIADHVVRLLFWRAIIFVGSTLDIDPVLVRAREKKSFNSLLTFRARNRIRHDHRIEMTKMRQTVGVVDGRGDVESHLVNRES